MPCRDLLQFDFLKALVKLTVPWDKVVAFHLDEYVGIPDTHEASFRKYLHDRLFSLVTPSMAEVHYLDPSSEKALEAYGARLTDADIDLACIGIGENGHIAFNVGLRGSCH